MHPTHGAFFPKHKIQCYQNLISALIDRQNELPIPKLLLTSKNPKVRGLVAELSHFEGRHCGVAPWHEV